MGLRLSPFGRASICDFIGACERARLNREPHAAGGFEEEAVAAVFRHVDVGRPIVVMRRPEIEGAALDLAGQHILRARAEIAPPEAHRRAALAASAGQMKDELTMRRFDRADEAAAAGVTTTRSGMASSGD
jgi:hypothetical protein